MKLSERHVIQPIAMAQVRTQEHRRVGTKKIRQSKATVAHRRMRGRVIVKRFKSIMTLRDWHGERFKR